MGLVEKAERGGRPVAYGLSFTQLSAAGAIAIAVAAALWRAHRVIDLSFVSGRLSIPPIYDDVVYQLVGFDLWRAFLDHGPIAGLRLLAIQHAPLQSLMAAVGYELFGVNQWSAYAVNGGLLVLLALGVLWIARPRPAFGRLALVAVVLYTPVSANLVAEFRPDIAWGMLTGFAVLLLLDARFLRSRRFSVATGLVAALALLAKPSAVPATVVVIGGAWLLSLTLACIEDGRRLRVALPSILKRALPSAIVVLLLAGPYFVLNAQTIRDYIYQALVAYRDVNETPGSFWYHATFYSIGQEFPFALSVTLWLGLAIFVAALIRGRMPRGDRARYICFGALVVLSYLIPTAAAVKSYFLGGVFYGTFLICTVRGAVIVFRPAEGRQDAVRWAGHMMATAGPVLLALIAFIARDNPLATPVYLVQSAELNAAAGKIIPDLERLAASRSKSDPAVVLVISPYPITANFVSLMARWKTLPLLGRDAYYLRSLPEIDARIADADFVIVSQVNGGVYPGAKLSLDVLAELKSRPDFEVASEFVHSNGLSTFLFHRR